MNTFDVAHFEEQGQQVIVVFVARELSESECARLQVCATASGLAGTVVPVWRSGRGFRFLAPCQWASFFETVPWQVLVANINMKLTCG